MKPAAAMLLVLALAGCQQASTAATQSPSSHASPNATAGVSALPSPSAIGVAFSCRLPVTVNNPGGSIDAGFLDTRTGRITIDPKVTNGLSYDGPLARWLPVKRSGLSPDGTRYAFGGGTNDLKPILHIVDIASGADHTYPLPSTLTIGLSGPIVLSYTDRAIYVGQPTEGGLRALWTFDLATHRTTFTDLSGIGVMDGTTAWRATLDATDRQAWSWPGVPPTNQVENLDVASGKQSLWLRSPGHLLDVIGVDSMHHPVVRDFVDMQTVEILLLTGPSTSSLVYRGPDTDWDAYLDGVEGDSHGVWFGGGKGVFVYSGGNLAKVTDQAAAPAGDCQDQS